MLGACEGTAVGDDAVDPDDGLLYVSAWDDQALTVIVRSNATGSTSFFLAEAFRDAENEIHLPVPELVRVSPDGRHLAMMPHPERTFLKWQAHWMPEGMKRDLDASPWLRMFQNAYDWCAAG